MAVTTANTLKLSDVCQEIYGSTSTSGKSLIGCHNAAIAGGFKSQYAVTGNTLLDFRGYEHQVLAWRPIDPFCVNDTWFEVLPLTVLDNPYTSGSQQIKIYSEYSWTSQILDSNIQSGSISLTNESGVPGTEYMTVTWTNAKGYMTVRITSNGSYKDVFISMD